MSRLVWSEPTERFFETGIDQGVLFVDENPGVAWSGLISVAESPIGGEARPFYIDGMKYLNLAGREEYGAQLTAFSSPPEFFECDGIVSVQNGLFVTNQRRKPFSFSYRTKVGDGVQGPKLGYKIHIVYNAMADPTSRTYETLGDDVEVTQLEWNISTLPPKITGYHRTAHLVVDSRATDPALMAAVEGILYGTEGLISSLPTAQEMADLFSGWTP